MSPDRYPTVSTDSVDSRFFRPSKPKQEAPEYVRIRKIMSADADPVSRYESKRVSNGDLRAEQERQRKERAERSKAAAKGGTGEFTLDQLRRQSELLAKAAAKRETTDNIGRAV